MDKNDPIDLNAINFKVAFAFEGYNDKELKDDPRFVKWIFRVFYKKEDVDHEIILPHHKCTEKDYAEFYPIKSAQEKTLNRVKESDKHSFLCIDWDDD